VATSALQLSDVDLVAPRTPRSPGEPTAGVVDRLQSLADALRSPVPQAPLPGVVARRATNRSEGTTVAAALRDRELQMLPGLRLDEQDLTSAPTGVRVVGPRDLVGSPGRARRIDPLVLAARYPTSRLTERGDVVFCNSPRPAARVDRDGGLVVAFPAKALRCRDDRLAPVVVAADINAQPESAKAWRAWPLRYVPNDQASALIRATDELAKHRADLLARIDTLDQLAVTLINGTAGGSLDLNEVEGN
jgi:hypothetical protein